MKILDNPKTWHFIRKMLDIAFGLYSKRMDVIHNFGVITSMSILDVACGTGQYSILTDNKYLGIDLSKKYIEYANKIYGKKNKKFIAKDINKLSYEARSFDVALLIDVTHHLTDDETKKMLKTLGRLVKKKIIICDPIKQNKKNYIGRFLTHFDRGKYIRPKKKLLNIINQILTIEKTAHLNLTGINTVCILAKPKK